MNCIGSATHLDEVDLQLYPCTRLTVFTLFHLQIVFYITYNGLRKYCTSIANHADDTSRKYKWHLSFLHCAIPSTTRNLSLMSRLTSIT